MEQSITQRINQCQMYCPALTGHWVCPVHGPQKREQISAMTIHLSQRLAYITCHCNYQPHMHVYQEVRLKS